MTGEMETVLAKWAQSRVGLAFAWGKVDCNLLGLEAFDLLTGLSIVEQVRGRYSTELGAARFAKKFHLNWTKELGKLCTQVRPVFAQPGDLLLEEDESGRGRWSVVLPVVAGGALVALEGQLVRVVAIHTLSKARCFRFKEVARG